jgi:CheY-like chemotaxis protein
MSQFQPFKPPSRDGGGGDASLKRAYSVLYVEDEDVNWELTEAALSGKYTLVRACNAKETFEWLARKQFDVILMDIQLSGSDLDGIEITKILKQKSVSGPAYTRNITAPNTPIVYVTAYSARYNRDELLATGAVEVATKPVSFASLAFILTRILLARSAEGAKGSST